MFAALTHASNDSLVEMRGHQVGSFLGGGLSSVVDLGLVSLKNIYLKMYDSNKIREILT